MKRIYAHVVVLDSERSISQYFPGKGKPSSNEPSTDLHGGLGILLLCVDVHRQRSAIILAAFAMWVTVEFSGRHGGHHTLEGHLDVVHFCMVVKRALGDEDEEEPGEKSELESEEERHKLEGGDTEGGGVRVCDIGERPHWKVIGDHERQRVSDAISGQGCGGVDQHRSMGGKDNISEGVRMSTVHASEGDERQGSQTEIGGFSSSDSRGNVRPETVPSAAVTVPSRSCQTHVPQHPFLKRSCNLRAPFCLIVT